MSAAVQAKPSGGFWPSSAQIREKYMALKEKTTTPPAGSPTLADSAFDALLAKLHAQLVAYFTVDDGIFDNNFRHTVHDLYKHIMRDEHKIFALFQHDVLLLLASVDISRVPLSATADFISVFEVLLSEITRRYDDYSAEFESVLQRTSKIMGVFLISCLKYNRLTTEKLEQISLFVLKLTQYYLTLTELVEYWFTCSLKAPDVMYLINKRRLPARCFPIYELMKDFLFMDEQLLKNAKDTLLHVILISCFSSSLENWILESDFPGLVMSGFLSTFHQICYSDALLTAEPDMSSFKDFEDFIKFVVDLLSYSNHDSIKVGFLNSFHTRFVMPLLEHLRNKSEYHINTLVLFTNTLERLVLPSDSNRFTNCLIVTYLVDQYFDELKPEQYIVNLYTDALLDPNEGAVVSLLPTLNLLSILTCANSPDLLRAVFFEDVMDDERLLPAGMLNSLSSKTRQLVRLEPELRSLIVEYLDESLRTLRTRTSLLTEPKQLLRFSPDDNSLGSVICVELFGFFNHGTLTNEQILTMVSDLAHANCGFTLGLFAYDNEHDTVLSEIMEYLWQSFLHYTQKLNELRMQNHPAPLIYALRASPTLVERITDLSPVAKKLMSTEELASTKVMLNPDMLQLNVDLYKILIAKLYALQRAAFTLHKVRFNV